MAKNKIRRITIEPHKGGHMVRHEFAPAAKYSGASRNGGMSMEAPPAAEKHFPSGQGNALLKHIAGALALGGGMPGMSQGQAGAQPGAMPGGPPGAAQEA
jgi:hypothetical protein